MITKINKTEISSKILKRKKIKVLLSESHQKLISTCAGWGLFFKPNMKQINKPVPALENDIVFWRPSWILLKLKTPKILMMAKMS